LNLVVGLCGGKGKEAKEAAVAGTPNAKVVGVTAVS